MDDLKNLIRDLDAANLRLYEEQRRFFELCDAVIQAAERAGVVDRRVFVISDGLRAWYLDPPSVTRSGQWEISWGGPPESERL